MSGSPFKAFRKILQSADIIQPDVCNTGGIMETKKIAAMAEAYNMRVAPHNCSSALSTAASLQIGACIANFMIQETFAEFDVPWRSSLVRGWNPVQKGELLLPDKPGLGIELDEEAIAAHPYVPNAFPSLWDEKWLTEFTKRGVERS